MTPSSVRKLLSLCARSESSARRSVSPRVTSALRSRPSFPAILTARGATRVMAPNPSMGVTPKQTSNLLYLRRSEEHTSELQSRLHLVCRLLLEKKKKHQH